MVLGMGFGILLHAKGYGIGWALAMSVFIYAGSMQYVAVGLLSGGASLISTAIMTVMVNARHLFYGISMIDRYKETGRAKPYLIFTLTDETYSLVCSGEVPEGIDRNQYFFWVSLFDHLYWIVGSVLGALAGSLLTVSTAGIEFSMTALFVVVFVEQWKSASSHLSAMIGVVSSVLCRVIFGADNFLIPSMLLITLSLSLCRNMLEKEEIREDEEKPDSEKEGKKKPETEEEDEGEPEAGENSGDEKGRELLVKKEGEREGAEYE